MNSRVAVIAIIVEDYAGAQEVNKILHDNGDYIIGRMGIPYKQKNINIISVAMDAPGDVINAVSGKIGRVAGVSVKTAYASNNI